MSETAQHFGLMRSRRAFTLLEMVIVLIVLSVLATIAMGTVHSAKARAYIATMQADMDRLRSAEESFYVENRRYSTDMNALGFRATSGVTIVLTSATDSTGYGAVATHIGLPRGQCGLFVGTEAVHSPAGVTMCTQAQTGGLGVGAAANSK